MDPFSLAKRPSPFGGVTPTEPHWPGTPETPAGDEQGEYMNFKMATDQLCDGITHSDVARALGLSAPRVREARLYESGEAHRALPEGWEQVVAGLAEKEAERLSRLATMLKAMRRR